MEKQVKYGFVLMCFSLVLIVSAFPIEGRAEFPDRPITIMVTFAPGGSTDMCTRAIAAAAEKILGNPVVVENKPGGGGTIGYALVANAKPDGYTLCLGTDSGIVRVPQLQKVTYSPLKSFTPIIAFVKPYNGIVVQKGAQWNSLKELIDYAKKNPNKIKYSTGGVATGMHHAMIVLEKQENLKWIHVPYQGNADAMTALIGGHVDVCSAGPEYVPFERSGAVKILAIPESEKNPKYPNVPTLKELGYDFANDVLFTIVGPAGLPTDVAKKLESAFTKAAQSNEVKTVINNLDLVPVLYVGKEYEEYLKNYWFRMEKTLKETGLIKEPATNPY
jgi:tripartite-type tricarboxylate transporter receptor subunit TctC